MREFVHHLLGCCVLSDKAPAIQLDVLHVVVVVGNGDGTDVVAIVSAVQLLIEGLVERLLVVRRVPVGGAVGPRVSCARPGHFCSRL